MNAVTAPFRSCFVGLSRLVTLNRANLLPVHNLEAEQHGRNDHGQEVVKKTSSTVTTVTINTQNTNWVVSAGIQIAGSPGAPKELPAAPAQTGAAHHER
jgi:hypothetical protein